MIFRRKSHDFRGHIDAITEGHLCGWVQDRQQPKRRQRVDIYYANELIGSVIAKLYRDDLKKAGIFDGYYGFTFPLPEFVLRNEGISARVHKESFWLLNNIPSIVFKNINTTLLNSYRRGFSIIQPNISQYSLKQIDIDLASEVIDLWSLIKSNNDYRFALDDKSMWKQIIFQRYKNLLNLLNKKNPELLANYLINIHKYPESNGLYQGEAAYRDFVQATPHGRTQATIPFHDMLASLSQYLSIERLECSEQGEDGRLLVQDSAYMVKMVEKKLGFKILLENIYDGVYGIGIDNKILHGRDIQALYLALRQSEILSNNQAKIGEIGAGFGISAYYAWLKGCCQYFIIDLAPIIILQYFTLKKLLPNVNIKIVTDHMKTQNECGIFLIAAEHISHNYKLFTDLFVNVDSLPEMGKNIVEEYLRVIPQWTQLLLSINQESNRKITHEDNRQIVTSEMLSKANYERLYRFRSWIRQGYAEELWKSPIRESKFI